MLSYACPHCGVKLQIPEKYAGKSGRCRSCSTTFTVQLQETPRPKKATESASNGNGAADKSATLIAVHIETTGPSTRKSALIELAGVKMDIDGNDLDTFWTFVNPDQQIPSKIVDRTGITDGMVAQGPYAIEAVKEFFQWAGPDPILFTHHARFQAKFLSAALLNEDIEPPDSSMIDVVEWAADIEIPAPEFKLIPLLLHFNCPIPEGHRALETAHGIRRLFTQLSALLQKRLAPVESSQGSGIMGMLGQRTAGADQNAVYAELHQMARPVNKITGADFSARIAYEARHGGAMATPGNGTPARATQDSKGYHRPEWFEEIRRALESTQRRAPSWSDTDDTNGNGAAPWAFAVLEASQCTSPEDEKQCLLKAIDLGAEDPWPYERLTGFFVQSKDYPAAQQTISKFFDTEGWKQPANAGSSLKLLDRMEKIERHMAQRR